MRNLWHQNRRAHRRIPLGLRLVAVLGLACLWLGRAAAGTTFTVSLDQFMYLGETATLGLKFEGEAPPGPPELPFIENLQVRYVGPSTEMTWVMANPVRP